MNYLHIFIHRRPTTETVIEYNIMNSTETVWGKITRAHEFQNNVIACEFLIVHASDCECRNMCCSFLNSYSPLECNFVGLEWIEVWLRLNNKYWNTENIQFSQETVLEWHKRARSQNKLPIVYFILNGLRCDQKVLSDEGVCVHDAIEKVSIV